MIYENSGKEIRKFHRVLSCVIYAIMENYFCIDYLSCQSKTLCGISSDTKFKEIGFKFITRYWNYRTLTEPSIFSWIHDEIKFNSDIKLPITSD